MEFFWAHEYFIYSSPAVTEPDIEENMTAYTAEEDSAVAAEFRQLSVCVSPA